MANLPPASVAEQDLPRFLSRALGRRDPNELPGLRALLDEEPLSGYPAGMGAVVASFVQCMVADSLDPGGLNPGTCARILASSAFLDALGQRVSTSTQLLRPGVVITPALRETLDKKIVVLAGVGPQLALVGPVELVHLPGTRHAVPRDPVLARPMAAEEADGVRAAWGALEEAVGTEGDLAEQWRARFVQVAGRVNHDVETARGGLKGIAPAERRRLWREVVAHLRDQQLEEAHRPGRRGLARRLTQIGFEIDAPWLEAFMPLASYAFENASVDPLVERGACPCTDEDLKLFGGWVEQAPAGRKHLAAMEPATVMHWLVVLSEVEQGRLDVTLEPELARPLRALRDKLLVPRYRRSAVVLDGIDPLALADARLDGGHDRRAILAELRQVAERAAAAAKARRGRLPLRPSPAERPRAAAEEARGVVSAPSLATPEQPHDEALEALSPLGVPPAPGPRSGRDALRTDPFAGLGTTSFELPPMPKPPVPRRRPATLPRSNFPPMPQPVDLPPPYKRRRPTAVDVAAGSAGEPPTPRAPQAAQATRPASQADPLMARSDPRPPPSEKGRAGETSPKATPRQRAAPAPSGLRPKSAESVSHQPSRPRRRAERPHTQPAVQRRRPPTIPHLVTPKQANEFYESAFRELEMLERDMLQRGPRAAAGERIDALEREASELSSALGPAARSGDNDFSAALRRVQRVQSYLARLKPMLDGRTRPPEPDVPRRRGVRRFFKRDN